MLAKNQGFLWKFIYCLQLEAERLGCRKTAASSEKRKYVKIAEMLAKLDEL